MANTDDIEDTRVLSKREERLENALKQITQFIGYKSVDAHQFRFINSTSKAALKFSLELTDEDNTPVVKR